MKVYLIILIVILLFYIHLYRIKKPHTTFVDFSAELSNFDIEKETVELDNVFYPYEFNWRYSNFDDTDEIKFKKSLISLPQNQGLCGACWSMACIDVIGDSFVVAGLVTKKPNLSVTWALSCYSQNKCQGGNPAILLKNIEKDGIPDISCIDYSWCSKDPKCNGEQPSISLHLLNENIPKCKCIYENSDFYYIEPAKHLSIISDRDTLKIQDIIKKYIFKYGPVLTGFTMFRNFENGKFTTINNGVYLEKGDYTGKVIKFNDDEISSEKIITNHAVSVIGWGTENIIIDNKGNTHNVPYWYCRNSWGDKWGSDKGYFKIAMYPWNKVSQLDKEIIDKTNNSSIGGMILIKCKDIRKK